LLLPASAIRWLVGLGGGVTVLAGLYLVRSLAARRELHRYAGGFPLQRCPACRQGNLHLEEYVSRTLGVPQVRRSVRCSVCRSVLREVKPSTWRYLIDPLADEELAQQYNGQLFREQELLDLADQRGASGPADPAAETPPSAFLTAMEERLLSYEPEEEIPDAESADNGPDVATAQDEAANPDEAAPDA
jgi:hypothetical protein